MSISQPTFDWKSSLPHVQLLSQFKSPRDLKHLNWQYLKELLNENVSVSIERFIGEGALVACPLEEVVERSLSLAQLKDIAAGVGLKGTGTKAQIIERILNCNKSELETAIIGKNFYKCSKIANDFLDEHARTQQNAARAAMQKTHELLIEGDFREAYLTLY